MKYYVFNGEDEDKWNKYSIKTLAFAETKGDVSEDMKKTAKNILQRHSQGKHLSF